MTNATGISSKRRQLTCFICDQPMWSGRSSRPQGEAAHRSCRTSLYTVDCKFCGVEFRSARRSGSAVRTRCCSKSCARRLEIKEGRHLLQDGVQVGRNPSKRRASNSRATYKRRAILRGVESDPYSIDLIAERGEGICHLCEEPVDMSIYWPNPGSPSADHVVPLSRGGHDTLENVKLSHLACNLSKGNRA